MSTSESPLLLVLWNTFKSIRNRKFFKDFIDRENIITKKSLLPGFFQKFSFCYHLLLSALGAFSLATDTDIACA
jgi:hypothetical protein